MLDGGNVYLEDQRIASDNSMALAYFGKVCRQADHPAQKISSNTDADKSEDRQVNFCSVNDHAIAQDHTGIFKLPDALEHRRSGEAHTTAQFREGQPCVCLQLGKDLPTNVVQEPCADCLPYCFQLQLERERVTD